MKRHTGKTWRHLFLGCAVLIPLIIAVFLINKLATTNPILSFKNQIFKGQPILSVKFSPDGIFLGCGNAYGDVDLLRIKDRRFISVNGLGGKYPIASMDFSQDGRYFAYCETNGRVTVVDMDTTFPMFTRETHDTASTGHL